MKRFFAFILTVVMALSLVACGGDSTSDSSDSDAVIPDGEISLRIGTSASDTSAITQGAQWFADKLNERTGGLVTVKVYSSDSISGGAQAKGIEMLMDGSADMTFHSNLIYSTLDARLNVISLPWMFDGYEDVDDTLGWGGRRCNCKHS